jgi:hypothetical protein
LELLQTNRPERRRERKTFISQLHPDMALFWVSLFENNPD